LNHTLVSVFVEVGDSRVKNESALSAKFSVFVKGDSRKYAENWFMTRQRTLAPAIGRVKHLA
jgi:hypothetical protein